MITKFDKFCLATAREAAKMSYCERKKVGAIIAKDGRIISIGYNGTLPGEDNCCEDDNNTTKTSVIHAEANAILKLTQSTESAKGATLYLTLSPCEACAQLILLSGITKVVYSEKYRCRSGLVLIDGKVETICYSE